MKRIVANGVERPSRPRPWRNSWSEEFRARNPAGFLFRLGLAGRIPRQSARWSSRPPWARRTWAEGETSGRRCRRTWARRLGRERRPSGIAAGRVSGRPATLGARQSSGFSSRAFAGSAGLGARQAWARGLGLHRPHPDPHRRCSTAWARIGLTRRAWALPRLRPGGRRVSSALRRAWARWARRTPASSVRAIITSSVIGVGDAGRTAPSSPAAAAAAAVRLEAERRLADFGAPVDSAGFAMCGRVGSSGGRTPRGGRRGRAGAAHHPCMERESRLPSVCQGMTRSKLCLRRQRVVEGLGLDLRSRVTPVRRLRFCEEGRAKRNPG